MADILEFQGENRWLSNFWPATVMLDGMQFPSVENAYQAAKTTDMAARYAFTRCTAGQAKRLGKSATIRSDWDSVKVGVMRDLLRQKFAAGTELGNRLLDTGFCNLIEGNKWGDTFWGVCNGRGENILGRLLIEQRLYLRG